MSFTEVVGKPGVGNLVLQHRGFRGKSFDLDYRAHKRVVRVLDRLDDGGNLGNWKLDQDATGDLALGMCWPQDKNQREIPMWSFHFPSVVANAKASGGGVATPGAGASFSDVATLINPSSPPSGGGKSSKMSSLPIGSQLYDGDGRMNSLPVPPRVLKAKGPTNPNAAVGAQGGANGIDDPSAGPQGNLFGPNGGRGGRGGQDTGGPVLILGIGGSIGSFGGQAVGIGFGFPTFVGVGNYFGQSGGMGAVFSGVRNFFGNGGAQVGATFTDPSAPPRPGGGSR